MTAQNQQSAAFPEAQKKALIAAITLFQAGQLQEARAAYRQILAAAPDTPLALNHLGIVEHQLGNSSEALQLFERCLTVKPDFASAYADLGAILMQLGRDNEARAACEKAVQIDPKIATAHSNLGDLSRRDGNHEAAEAAYSRAVKLQPNFPTAHASRADALIELGRLREAEKACDKAVRQAPRLALAHGVKGLILHQQNKLEKAAATYRKALQLDPGLAIVHTRLANVLREQGALEEAIAANKQALQADPACVEAYCNLALTYQSLGRYDEALQAFSDALTLHRDHPDTLSALGLLQHHIGEIEQAIATLRHAIRQAPDAGHGYVNLGSILKDQGQHREALEIYQKMLDVCAKVPPQGLYDYCNLRRQICDWAGLDEAEVEAVRQLADCGDRMPPFSALAMKLQPRDHLELNRRWASGFRVANPLANSTARSNTKTGNRIRIAYLSADFYQHATATLLAELIEQHDRNRFEIFAYCMSPDDGSPMRRRLIDAFDAFHIIEPLTHGEAAAKIAADNIDILIDLKGYTRRARSMILAHRPALIQVNYLGYPSTMGAAFMDYIIADPIVAPMAHQPYFDEKIVQLPDCYQPNDRHREIGNINAPRISHGLPESGFVFCSFNNAYKITAPVFDVWMRLLRQVQGSVLWLLDTNPLAKDNLRREANARGISPERLVFAPRVSTADHLARYAHADLFLDNLPVNAHTTASEALWMGLPLVTCLGDVFVGRVAASLLSACGAAELITESLADYEALALRLARSPDELAAIGNVLADARHNAPLFDTARYTADLEAAFAHMVSRLQSGQAPAAFAVSEMKQVTQFDNAVTSAA